MDKSMPGDEEQSEEVVQPGATPEFDQSSYQYSTYYYLPISLVVLAGYLVGLYGWYRCGIAPEVIELNDVNLYAALFALGLVGGAMSCSVFLAKDANKVMYGESTKLPNWVDVFGYLFQVIGGGFTGLAFYLVAKLGIDVATGNTSATDLTPEAGWLMALAGGLATNRIKEFIVNLVETKTGGGKEPAGAAAAAGKVDKKPPVNGKDDASAEGGQEPAEK
jgi:hypothetical protein